MGHAQVTADKRGFLIKTVSWEVYLKIVLGNKGVLGVEVRHIMKVGIVLVGVADILVAEAVKVAQLVFRAVEVEDLLTQERNSLF